MYTEHYPISLHARRMGRRVAVLTSAVARCVDCQKALYSEFAELMYPTHSHAHARAHTHTHTFMVARHANLLVMERLSTTMN